MKDSKDIKAVREYWLTQFQILENKIERAGFMMSKIRQSKGQDRVRWLFIELLEILDLVDHEVIRGMQFAWLERRGHFAARRLTELEEVVGNTIDKLFDHVLGDVTREEFEIALSKLLTLRRAQNRLLLKDERLREELAARPVTPLEDGATVGQTHLLGLSPKAIKQHFEKMIEEKIPQPLEQSPCSGADIYSN